MTPGGNTTNTDLAVMIGELRGDVLVVAKIAERLDKTINGNGKPGLISCFQELDAQFQNHVSEYIKEKKAAEKAAEVEEAKKKKRADRTWAIVMLIIGGFITQTMGLLFILIKTGIL